MLGFDKESIMDKNITRIMPKVYSELHNSFITSFIRRKDTQTSPDTTQVRLRDEEVIKDSLGLEKMVTPLDS